MENCPKCNQKLNIDEKTSGRCFSCGATFTSPLPKDKPSSYSSPSFLSDNLKVNMNRVAFTIRMISSIIHVIGTIAILYIAITSESFLLFLIPELLLIVFLLPIDAFAEIITLLQDIKDKL